MDENDGLEQEVNEPTSSESVQEDIKCKNTHIQLIVVTLVIVILGLAFVFIVSQNNKANETPGSPEVLETKEVTDSKITITPLIIDESLETEGVTPIMQYELDQPKITVSAADSRLVYLTGPNGMALYTPTEECTGECMNDWKPYVVLAPVPEGTDYNSTYISTINLLDAELQQYTWDDIPLYYYKKDVSSGEEGEFGEIRGEGVDERWSLVVL